MAPVQAIQPKNIYEPFPKQLIFHNSTALNRLFGGAAGPGKSHAFRMEAVRIAQSAPFLRIGIFRRTFPELEASVIVPLLEILPKHLYKYNESKHVMTFANGSRIKFGHVQYDKDVYKYQGEEFDAIGIDELTLFNEFQFRFLKGRLRTTKPYWTPCFFATSNPGNIGHAFVKKLWIDRDYSDKPSDLKESWEYIPALVYDNPVLMREDPGYIARLEGLDEDAKKAFLYWDWDSFAGQYFKEWRKDIHVVAPFRIPKEWRRVICLDYWYTAPSAVLWLAIDHDKNVYCYRELYVTKHTYEELVQEVIRRTDYEDWEVIFSLVADPALQAKSPDSGVSFFDVAKKNKLPIIPGVNDRIPGWQVMRKFLKVSEDDRLSGTARLRVFPQCANLIRTLPQLIYDDLKTEDLNSAGEDHAPDALRYGLVFINKDSGSLAQLSEANNENRKKEARRKERSSTPIMLEHF